MHVAVFIFVIYQRISELSTKCPNEPGDGEREMQKLQKLVT